MQDLGFSYWAITDHSRSSFQANGLDAARLRQQLKEMRALNQRLAGEGSDFRLLTSFPITGDLVPDDGPDANGIGTVDIFVPTYKVEPPKGPISIDLPIIGATVTGKAAK